MSTQKTVHTGRTIMFKELQKVMDHGLDNDDYVDAIKQNVVNKATKSGVAFTSQFLKRLYDFDVSLSTFFGI